MKIDSHFHCWKYNPSDYQWIGEEMGILKKDYLANEINTQLIENNFNGAVAVQANQSLEENDFLLHIAAQSELIKGVVGWVDFSKPNVLEYLQKYSVNATMKGFRHILEGEENQFMFNVNFIKGIKLLKEFEFTYDILVNHHQLNKVTNLLNLIPGQKFILDHLGKPPIKDRQMSDWKKNILEISAFENVFCKVSGIITEADHQHWTENDLKPYLDFVFNCFGTDRLIFGSDYPVCLLAGSYSDVVTLVENYLNGFTIHERNKIMGLNAIKFYNLD